MNGSIEIRAFMGLTQEFRERGWSSPHSVDIPPDLSGPALLETLGLSRDQVESLIVNRRTVPIDQAVLHPGDRVALVPPGVPGPHRFLLGIRRK